MYIHRCVKELLKVNLNKNNLETVGENKIICLII